VHSAFVLLQNVFFFILVQNIITINLEHKLVVLGLGVTIVVDCVLSHISGGVLDFFITTIVLFIDNFLSVSNLLLEDVVDLALTLRRIAKQLRFLCFVVLVLLLLLFVELVHLLLNLALDRFIIEFFAVFLSEVEPVDMHCCLVRV